MRTCAWLAAGGILLFAVSGHPSFLNLQVVGLILLARGAAGYWLGLGADRRARYLERLRTAAVTFEAFIADLTSDGGRRVPVEDLLSPQVKENGLR